jgi:hypothetical protein
MLSEHTGTMLGSELKSACLGMGLNRPTFYRALLYSPIISKYPGGPYGLIGTRERSGRGARLAFTPHRVGEHS